MKSRDVLPISPAFVELARRERRSRSFDDDDPICEIVPLGALAGGPPNTLAETAPLVRARALFLELRIPAIVIVDAVGALRGIVTRTDVLRELARRADATCGEAMSGIVFALPEHARVEHAAALMAHESVGQIVVTGERGELVGMVSALDVARELARRAGFAAA